METLAFKANARLIALEIQIKEIEPEQEVSRSAIFSRALQIVSDNTDWKVVKEELGRWVANNTVKDTNATVMQVKINEEQSIKIEAVRKMILRDLSDEIKVLQTQYFVQLLFLNYLTHLKNNAMSSNSIDIKDADGPQMVEMLTRMLMLNREADREKIDSIKHILLEWKRSF